MVRPLSRLINPRPENPLLHRLIDEGIIDAHALRVIRGRVVGIGNPLIFIMSSRHPGIDKFLLGENSAQIAILGTDQLIVLGAAGLQVEIPQ